MEFRQLQAFEAVATDLHFGRAAQRLFTSQPAVSEQIRRLERELGTPLFRRTSRRVELTAAGDELLSRARSILAQVDDAAAAVKRLGAGTSGSIRLGVTPPALPVLAPHLIAAMAEAAPGITVDLRQMWLPDLQAAILGGALDAGLTPGQQAPPSGVATYGVGREPLLAGLRPTHRLAGRSHVGLAELAHDVLGRSPESLFPAWVQSHMQVLRSAGVEPPTTALYAPDISAALWFEQPEIDWILLTPSLAASHQRTKFVGFSPPEYIDFSVSWLPKNDADPSLSRFLDVCRTAELPPGWVKPS